MAEIKMHEGVIVAVEPIDPILLQLILAIAQGTESNPANNGMYSDQFAKHVLNRATTLHNEMHKQGILN